MNKKHIFIFALTLSVVAFVLLQKVIFVSAQSESVLAYPISNFQFNNYIDSQTGAKVEGALFDVKVQAVNADVLFYKNISVSNYLGKQGTTTILGISSGVVDSVDYYRVPVGTTATVNVQSLFSPDDLSQGSTDLNVYFPTSSTDTAPAPQSINGVCGASDNVCSVGTLVDTEDAVDGYNWQCKGFNGGVTSSCNIPISPVDYGLCGFSNNECVAGTLVDATDTAANYLWSCNGTSGANRSCSLKKPPFIGPLLPSTTTKATSSTPFPISITNITLSKLAAPYVTTDSSCGGKVSVTWPVSLGSVGYDVYRSDKVDGTYVLIQSDVQTTLPPSPKGLSILTDYYSDTPGSGKFYYKISAKNDKSGMSVASKVVTASKLCKPNITINVTVVTSGANSSGQAICPQRAFVSWSPDVNAETYKIYKSTTVKGTYKLIFSYINSGRSYSSYTDGSGALILDKKGKSTSETSYYKVSATNSVGTTQSEPVAVTVSNVPCVSSTPSVASTTGTSSVSINASVVGASRVKKTFVQSLLGNVWNALNSLLK